MYGNEYQIYGWKWMWTTHEDGKSDIDFHNDGILVNDMKLIL